MMETSSSVIRCMRKRINYVSIILLYFLISLCYVLGIFLTKADIRYDDAPTIIDAKIENTKISSQDLESLNSYIDISRGDGVYIAHKSVAQDANGIAYKIYCWRIENSPLFLEMCDTRLRFSEESTFCYVDALINEEFFPYKLNDEYVVSVEGIDYPIDGTSRFAFTVPNDEEYVSLMISSNKWDSNFSDIDAIKVYLNHRVDLNDQRVILDKINSIGKIINFQTNNADKGYIDASVRPFIMVICIVLLLMSYIIIDNYFKQKSRKLSVIYHLGRTKAWIKTVEWFKLQILLVGSSILAILALYILYLCLDKPVINGYSGIDLLLSLLSYWLVFGLMNFLLVQTTIKNNI